MRSKVRLEDNVRCVARGDQVKPDRRDHVQGLFKIYRLKSLVTGYQVNVWSEDVRAKVSQNKSDKRPGQKRS